MSEKQYRWRVTAEWNNPDEEGFTIYLGNTGAYNTFFTCRHNKFTNKHNFEKQIVLTQNAIEYWKNEMNARFGT